MPPIIEYFKPGDHLTCTVGATPVVGGQLVELSASRTVIPAAADSVKVAGVALYDAAVGEKVAVASEGMWPVVASGALTAGMRLVAAANGTAKAAPTGGGAYVQGETTFYQRSIGFAVEDIANGVAGRVQLTL